MARTTNVFIRKQQNQIKMLPVNNFTSPRSSFFQVSDNLSNLLRTKMHWETVQADSKRL